MLYHGLVAHGAGSGDNYATHFSNVNDSRATSLGLFLTGDTYEGGNGYSLGLRGLDPGVNDLAESRHIVMHGAWYVSDEHARQFGMIGRSWGCPALPQADAQPVIDADQGRHLRLLLRRLCGSDCAARLLPHRLRGPSRSPGVLPDLLLGAPLFARPCRREPAQGEADRDPDRQGSGPCLGGVANDPSGALSPVLSRAPLCARPSSSLQVPSLQSTFLSKASEFLGRPALRILTLGPSPLCGEGGLFGAVRKPGRSRGSCARARGSRWSLCRGKPCSRGDTG